MKIITIASDPNFPGHLQLKRSLDHFGYDYEVLIYPFEFGRQMKHIYDWCKANWGWFLYTDAYDTFALAEIAEIRSAMVQLDFSSLSKYQMLISTEKACYPHPEMASRYPESISQWKYVNGGGFISNCEFFVKLYEDGSHHQETNDQVWLAEQFLKRQSEIKLDTECKIFQTIAFSGEDNFSYEYKGEKREKKPKPFRLVNNQHNTLPIFIHGNGHTDMSLIYKLLP